MDGWAEGGMAMWNVVVGQWTKSGSDSGGRHDDHRPPTLDMRLDMTKKMFLYI